MSAREEIRGVVAEQLGVPADSIDFDADLVNSGMNSMMLMHLAARWRRQGYDIRSSSLMLEPRINAWAELLVDGQRHAVPDAPAAAPPREPEFELATMQHAYWIGRRQGQRLGGVAAHLYAEFDGAGLEPARFRRAVQRLVRRHEMLRVQFLDRGTQRILAEPSVPTFEFFDLSAETVEANRAHPELDRIRQDKSHQGMDIASGQVIDIALSALPDGRHRVHLDVDMVAADAQSYRRVVDDLAALYEADEDTLDPIGFSYHQYRTTRSQHSSDTSVASAWWHDRLPELPDVPTLPTVPENERQDPTRSVRLHHWFDAEIKDRLYRNARASGVTPVVALATVFGETVARWSEHQRFLLNVPLFNREPLHPNVDLVVGEFSNSILVDVDARTRESVAARAKRLQRELHACAAHADYEGLDVLRDLSRLRGSPVVPSVVFTSGLDLGELFSDRVRRTLGEPVWILSQGPQVDLDAQVVELDGGLLVNWDLRRDALPAGVAEAMFAEFCGLLGGLGDDHAWSAPLRIELPLAQRDLRARVNDTGTDYPARTLHGAFFEQALSRPDGTALRWRNGGSATYAELAGEALAVAHALSEAGVEPGDTVAVIVATGHAQIPAVLGVLAAGAAYLPIGTDQPNTRRDRILDRGNVAVALVDHVDDLPATVTAVELDAALAGPRQAQPHIARPDSVAYVMFTSGSTGEPKGVEVPHRAAGNTLDAIDAMFGVGSEDSTIGLSLLSFDVSVYDVFGPLSHGGFLVCIDQETERDAAAWAELIAENGVTVLNCAPGFITMLADTATPEQLRSLRLVLSGGDRVQTALGRRMRSAVPGLRFFGLGGTTETAIHLSYCEVTDDVPAEWINVPYGKPLANFMMRVVNERGEDCPDWVPGELWVGGISVADGYRGDPERTAEKFVEVDGVRWYRTGDRARYFPDGTVDFLGRADHQVKIRGYRVELGEVEAALVSLPDVDEAVVVLTDAGRLAAGVAAHAAVTATSLRDDLRDLLPDYMIPSVIEVLDDIPVTPNGKLDRGAIRRSLGSDDPGAATAYVPPADEIEAAVEFITAEVLGVARLGVETDFFDAGGNSILATTLTGQIRGLLAVSELGVATILDGRTVRRIASTLRSAESDPARLEKSCRILLELAQVDVPDTSAV